MFVGRKESKTGRGLGVSGIHWAALGQKFRTSWNGEGQTLGSRCFNWHGLEDSRPHSRGRGFDPLPVFYPFIPLFAVFNGAFTSEVFPYMSFLKNPTI